MKSSLFNLVLVFALFFGSFAFAAKPKGAIGVMDVAEDKDFTDNMLIIGGVTAALAIIVINPIVLPAIMASVAGGYLLVNSNLANAVIWCA